MKAETDVLENPVREEDGFGLTGSKWKETERELIKSMAGCYTVKFKFAETFAPDENYQYRDRKFEEAKEYVFIVEETENKISLLHLLYVGKNMVIKHWRQDWIYENRDFLTYVKDHEWEKTNISAEKAAGTWTQKVFQVDDTPRYQGYGTWVHVDGRHFWESTADAPLARRDYTIRNDYNVLRRHSHIEIFDNGDWILEQDNEKMIRTEDRNDTLLCMEKGLETFTREDYDPKVAVEWWEDNRAFWSDVKDCWTDFIAIRDQLKVNVYIGKQSIYMTLFGLAAQFAGEAYDSEKAAKAIRSVFKNHVENYA